jgi:hypothetical protein
MMTLDAFNLDRYNLALSPVLLSYKGAELLSRTKGRFDAGGAARLEQNNTAWHAEFTTVPGGDGPPEGMVVDLSCTFTLAEGATHQTAVGLVLSCRDWSTDNYVLLPGGAYNGNRFGFRVKEYAPMFGPEDRRPDLPTTITDVPRLNVVDGPSRLQLLARDLTTPAAAFFAPAQGQGVLALCDERTDAGPVGITVIESKDRTQGEFMFSAPGVREGLRYEGCRMIKPSEDRGRNFAPGESVSLRLRVIAFPCKSVPELFARFCVHRKDLTGQVTLTHDLPFAAAWAIQEEKYNRDNWSGSADAADGGYYSVGLRDNIHQDWQTGWVGGLMSTHPLLMLGSDLSRARALSTFDFVFAGGQAPGGLLYGCGHEGAWFGDDFTNMADKDFHLVRKSADALFFLCKQWDLLHKQGVPVKPAWQEGTRRLADAFVALWDRHGQWGQFVNAQTLDILVGGSASASIAPAGLALAFAQFGNPDYRRVAEAGAEYLYQNFTQNGVTTGGPGEILQCPDSESAYGMLESFVTLWEVTGQAHYLDKAKDAAHQCASWNVSYDFVYPSDALFGRLELKSVGAVLANVQNKHGAPGICTLSGDSLLKLWRATGDAFYLQMLRETARGITQYLSREDRPIGEMPSGWMCERVNLSDWDNNIGGVFYGSCWCEVSCMLTWAEVPGLYVRPDTGFVVAFDHVDAEVVKQDGQTLTVRVSNPTQFAASVSVLVETEKQARLPLGQNRLWNANRLALAPGEARNLILIGEQ